MTSAPASLPEIEIFRSGTFTSVQGDRLTFSAEDLHELRDSYDPALNPAPLVVGHPQLDAPAYGWCAALAINDAGVLVATPDRVEPAFAEMVEAGRFRRVSAELYPRDHPHNPTPGKLHLKHVGFLGAAAPAVKGLKPVAFGEAGQGDFITVEHNMKDQFMTKDEHADRTAAFAEREASIKSREERLAEGEAELARQRDEVAQARTATLHADHVSFAEGVVAAGKLAPFAKAELVHVLDQVAQVKLASFGEGDAARDPASIIKGWFDQARPIVSFGEAAPADPAPARVASFAAPSGHVIDPVALEVHDKALQLQRAEPGLSYIDAVKRAS